MHSRDCLQAVPCCALLTDRDLAEHLQKSRFAREFMQFRKAGAGNWMGDHFFCKQQKNS